MNRCLYCGKPMEEDFIYCSNKCETDEMLLLDSVITEDIKELVDEHKKSESIINELIDCEHKETDITFPDDRGETFGGIIETCLDCGEILNKEE